MTAHAVPIGVPAAPVATLRQLTGPGFEASAPPRARPRSRGNPQGLRMNRTGHCRWPELRRAARAGVALALAGLALAACSQAESAGNYPTKPVRIFVPYGPGGVGDLTMRVLAAKVSENLKQRFIIENRPGAGGTIAMKSVLDAPADGYAIGELGNGQAIATTLFTKLPYDILKDFGQVSIAASFPLLIAVSTSSPYRSLKDVVEAGQKNPGKLNLGAVLPGSTQNLSAYLFKPTT